MIANRIRMRKKKGGTWDGIFADPEVGRVLKARGLIADVNKSSIEELATIKSLNPSGRYNTSYFYNNKVITQFPELQYCTGLTSLAGTFQACSNLTTVGGIIPEGVTSLEYGFGYCSRLTKAPVIPSSVTNLEYAFENCSRIDGIYIINAVKPPYLRNSFSSPKAIYVPDESVSAYKSKLGTHSVYVYPMSQLPE